MKTHFLYKMSRWKSYKLNSTVCWWEKEAFSGIFRSSTDVMSSNFHIIWRNWCIKLRSNDPTSHPTFHPTSCWVKCWIVWPPCWVIQHRDFRCWVKFDRDQKCWVRTPNISIVFRCWVNCWVVWPPHPTLLATCMRNRLCLESANRQSRHYRKCWVRCWVKCWIVWPLMLGHL